MSSIAIKEIPEEAYNYSSYNGFCYEYSLIKDVESPTRPEVILPKGKMYTGAHGSDDLDKNCNVDDGYSESCKDKDFRLLFCGTEPVFKLKVWYLVKNWTEAKDEEHRVLKEFDNGIGAAKSKMSWNQHNGFPSHISINRKACKAIVDEILKRGNCKWGVVYATTKDYLVPKDDSIVAILSRIQVRRKDDLNHKKDIKHRINDKDGVVKLDKNKDIDPTVIFEKRASDGRDQLIDGNMTSGAICQKDCKAQEVPEIRVPLEDHEHLSNDEVRHISNMLNRKGKKVKKSIDVEDAIKFLLDITNNGDREYDTKFNRSMIKGDYDLSSDQTNRVMKGVKDELFAAEQASINMVLPAYSDEEKQEFVDKLKNTFPNEIIFYFAAAMADKIPMKMMENALKDVEEAKASIPEREPFKKIRLVTHYSQSKSVRDEWIKEDTGEWAIIKKRWDNMNGDYIIAYEEMPLTVKDTK